MVDENVLQRKCFPALDIRVIKENYMLWVLHPLLYCIHKVTLVPANQAYFSPYILREEAISYTRRMLDMLYTFFLRILPKIRRIFCKIVTFFRLGPEINFFAVSIDACFRYLRSPRSQKSGASAIFQFVS